MYSRRCDWLYLVQHALSNSICFGTFCLTRSSIYRRVGTLIPSEWYKSYPAASEVLRLVLSLLGLATKFRGLIYPLRLLKLRVTSLLRVGNHLSKHLVAGESSMLCRVLCYWYKFGDNLVQYDCYTPAYFNKSGLLRRPLHLTEYDICFGNLSFINNKQNLCSD